MGQRNETRDLLALPVRHGGLGIINPTRNSRFYHQSSKSITAPLTSLISEQSLIYHQEAKAQQLTAKKEAIRQRKQRDSAAVPELEERLANDMKRAMQVSTEKGASSWLVTLPIAEHGFALHKGAFLPSLWMAPTSSTTPLHLRAQLHSRACTHLHPWWFPIHLPQQAERHYSWTPY